MIEPQMSEKPDLKIVPSLRYLFHDMLWLLPLYFSLMIPLGGFYMSLAWGTLFAVAWVSTVAILISVFFIVGLNITLDASGLSSGFRSHLIRTIPYDQIKFLEVRLLPFNCFSLSISKDGKPSRFHFHSVSPIYGFDISDKEKFISELKGRVPGIQIIERKFWRDSGSFFPSMAVLFFSILTLLNVLFMARFPETRIIPEHLNPASFEKIIAEKRTNKVGIYNFDLPPQFEIRVEDDGKYQVKDRNTGHFLIMHLSPHDVKWNPPNDSWLASLIHISEQDFINHAMNSQFGLFNLIEKKRILNRYAKYYAFDAGKTRLDIFTGHKGKISMVVVYIWFPNEIEIDLFITDPEKSFSELLPIAYLVASTLELNVSRDYLFGKSPSPLRLPSP